MGGLCSQHGQQSSDTQAAGRPSLQQDSVAGAGSSLTLSSFLQVYLSTAQIVKKFPGDKYSIHVHNKGVVTMLKLLEK